MNEIAYIREAKAQPGESVAALVQSAASKLAEARSAAEVLDARDRAALAYDMAKSAARLARAKKAHDEVIVAAYRMQGDALKIESAAKHRLADEYDAAQKNGEARADGQRGKAVPDENTFLPPTVEEIGLNRKEVHEARQLRAAEIITPGIIGKTVDRLIDAGEEPTKAAVRREIFEQPRREPLVADDSLWLWGYLREFEREGFLEKEAAPLLAKMTQQMRGDVRRLAPLVGQFLERLQTEVMP